MRKNSGVLIVDVAQRTLHVEVRPVGRRPLRASPRDVDRCSRAQRQVVADGADPRTGVVAVGVELFAGKRVVQHEDLRQAHVHECGAAVGHRIAAPVFAVEIHRAAAAQRIVEVQARGIVVQVPHVALGVAPVPREFSVDADAIGQSALRVDPERKMAAVAQVRHVVVQPAAREGPERHRVESRGLAVLELCLQTAGQV